MRVERVIHREQVDRATARWLCEKTDREREGFLYSVYGRRCDDPAGYDAVLRVTGLSVDAEVKTVRQALACLTVTEEARRALHLRVAAARVKAGIATDPSFFIPTLDVFPEGEGLVLHAVTHTSKEQRRIEEAARRLASGIPIRCALHFRD